MTDDETEVVKEFGSVEVTVKIVEPGYGEYLHTVRIGYPDDVTDGAAMARALTESIAQVSAAADTSRPFCSNFYSELLESLAGITGKSWMWKLAKQAYVWEHAQSDAVEYVTLDDWLDMLVRLPMDEFDLTEKAMELSPEFKAQVWAAREERRQR